SNLAVAFAQVGERVLVIDGDLRRPRAHRNFHVSNEVGLSRFLAQGETVDELEALVRRTEVEGVDLLPCGPRPPNPAELLNTPRVEALIAWARSRYDRVLIDCTPMFPMSDTLLWIRHVKSLIFIATCGETRLQLIRNACQRVVSADAKILGVV